MGHLLTYFSMAAVAALAMRPKLSLAVVATVPASLALYESLTDLGLPVWAMIGGMLASSYALGGVLLATLFRRAGDSSYDGELPLGREMRYSRADRAGLWYTFTLLIVGTSLCALAGSEPPYGSITMRIIAFAAVPVFALAAIAFWRLLRDTEIVVRTTEDGLEIDGALHPWSDLAGYTFWFGIFRVYDKAGRMVLRVDNTIDGFPALLYHVNRKTIPR